MRNKKTLVQNLDHKQEVIDLINKIYDLKYTLAYLEDKDMIDVKVFANSTPNPGLILCADKDMTASLFIDVLTNRYSLELASLKSKLLILLENKN